MADVVKLIVADLPVRLMPDATTADELRKLDDFWSGRATEAPDRDLAAADDDVMRSSLARDGINAVMPDAVRDVVQVRRRVLLAPLALAACLVGAVAIGSLTWRFEVPDGAVATPERPPTSPDPYVFARPDRPAAGADRAQAPATGGGLQVAAVRGASAVGDLTRAEVHEMQRLLTRLGYGPLVPNGMPSKALDDAMLYFRIDQGLDPEDPRPREGLVMLRLAARVEALRAPRDGVSDR